MKYETFQFLLGMTGGALAVGIAALVGGAPWTSVSGGWIGVAVIVLLRTVLEYTLYKEDEQ